MEIRLSQLVVERDSVTAESQALQNQLDKAKAMVRTVREHEALCVLSRPDGASSCPGGENRRKSSGCEPPKWLPESGPA